MDLNKIVEQMGLFGEMGPMQEKIKELQRQVAQLRATKETGAGLVQATVNGNKQLVAVSVDDALLHPKDRIMLQDLIVAAVNGACEEVEQRTQEIVQQSAFGL